MNELNWHVINWEKADKITNMGDDIWDYLAKEANVKLDEYENLPMSFTWEDGYKCNLPVDGKKEYLCYFKELGFYVYKYDDKNDSPCFWDKSIECPVYPEAWADISDENPLE